MNYESRINPAVLKTPPSGIRRFFDLASTMDDAISLGVGEPDFVTPYHIRDAAVNSIVDGGTQYTANRGLMELRREIALYLEKRFALSYDPAAEMVVTVGASEAIDLCLRVLVSPGDEVLIPDPSYVSYAPGVLFCGGVPVPVRTVSSRRPFSDRSSALSSPSPFSASVSAGPGSSGSGGRWAGG